MKLYLSDIKTLELEEKYVSQLDEKRREKLFKLCKEDDKKRSLAAGLLLNDIVVSAYGEVFVGEFGKPYVKNGVCFNLSHSGDYVLLAVDEKSIGCDIEQVQEKKFEALGKIVFQQNEREILGKSDNKEMDFYKMWTQKEAFLKAVGEGFHRECRSVDLSLCENVIDNNKKFYFKRYDFDDYCVCVCCENDDFPNELIIKNY